jgi:phosphoglycolate phosphatase
MPAYRLAIFDFDGTLADSAEWGFGVMNDMARRHGYRVIDDAEREHLRGRPNHEVIQALGVPLWKLPFIVADFRRLAAENAAKIPLFPFAAAHLDRLRGAGVIVAIASSNSRSTIERILGDAAEHVVDFACGASLFGKAAKFHGLMRRHRVAPDQVVAVGDEERDVTAAREAGIASIAVSWGLARRPALEAAHPTAIVDEPAELERLILDGPAAAKP